MEADLKIVRASSYFDAEWYLKKYPDVKRSGVEAALHYLKFGAKEERDPGPKFSTRAYLREHPELLNSSENPLVHFLKNIG